MARKRKDDLRIDRVEILWYPDEHRARSSVCSAMAWTSYALAEFRQAQAIHHKTADRRIQTFTSGGLYGIESGGSQEYIREITDEQLDDLRLHLKHFGIDPDDQTWNRLVSEAIDRWQRGSDAR